jgi:hypothetical protein
MGCGYADALLSTISATSTFILINGVASERSAKILPRAMSFRDLTRPIIG